MKRKNWIVTLIIAAGLMQSASASTIQNCNVSVTVDQQKLYFDQQPVIKNDRVLVPVRAIFEALGAEVSWNETERKVTAVKGDKCIELSIDNNIMINNGNCVTLDTPPCIIGDRTMVPVRAISECFGSLVSWDSANNNVSINTNNSSNNNSTINNNTDSTTDSNSSFAYKVFQLVNEERAKYGLSSLSWSNDLSNVAYAHSVDMSTRNFMAHTNPDGLSPFDRIKNYGISYSYAAENIAAGQSTPEEVINAWMNSEGHRANILSKNLTTLGVGYYKGSGQYTHYWTQCFIAQ